MNKILVTIFESEADAYKGLDTLKELDRKADITLYATAVVSKDNDGKLTVKQGADSGPIGTTTGMLTGALVGLLGGPVGAAVGVAAGGVTGAAYDLTNAGIGIEFLDDVANSLVPGKTAVLADIDEEWETPIDTKMKELNAEVLRRSPEQIVEDQLTDESTEDEISESLKSKAQSIKENTEKTLNQIKSESEAKINKLEAQLKEANEEQKAKIEARIAAIKQEQKQRSEKLQKAKESVQDVFSK